MKIKIAAKRDGGTIYLDGKRVGYIEAYRGGPCFVRFATSDDAPFMGYGTTEAVARIKYQGFAEAKKFAKQALVAAGGDFKELAARAKAGTWGTPLIDSFAR